MSQDGWMETLRREELSRVLAWLPPGARVLEVGGGNGFQAALLAEHGCQVESIDLEQHQAWAEQHFPVQGYDGRHIPFPDASFDRVFSSHVLEHVPHLPELLAEVRRVLKPGGLAVHIMPSTAWRFWTSLAHYPYAALYALGKAPPFPGAPSVVSSGDVMRRKGLARVIFRALSAGPHGEYRNAAVELWAFSRPRWSRVLRQAGFELEHEGPSGVFLTGYGLFRRWDVPRRCRLARWLGSGSNVFITRAAGAPAP